MLSRDQETESSLRLSKDQEAGSSLKLSNQAAESPVILSKEAENSKRPLSLGLEAESSERLYKDAKWFEAKKEEAHSYRERSHPQVG